MISRDQQSELLQQSQLSPQYSDAEMVSKASDLKGIETINMTKAWYTNEKED